MGKKRQAATAAGTDTDTVTVTVQPVTRADCCGQPLTYPREAGAASAALTSHLAKHPPCQEKLMARA